MTLTRYDHIKSSLYTCLYGPHTIYYSKYNVRDFLSIALMFRDYFTSTSYTAERCILPRGLVMDGANLISGATLLVRCGVPQRGGAVSAPAAAVWTCADLHSVWYTQS
jgi:hypothetical protein